MKSAEVIMVRSTGRTLSRLPSILKELMQNVAMDRGEESIRVFHRENIKTDYCIVLFRGEETAKSCGNRLGLRLVAALKEFGMVHHTVWMEMDQSS